MFMDLHPQSLGLFGGDLDQNIYGACRNGLCAQNSNS